MKDFRYYFLSCILLGFGIVTAIEENHFTFVSTIDEQQYIGQSTYAKFVQYLPICCVDVFVYDPKQEKYLLVKRDNPPAKGAWWYPGGRIYKGESFFSCAKRKCKEEMGIDVDPLSIIDVYSTVFPDSAWNCQTHTINVAIFAFFKESTILLDSLHEDFKWQSIKTSPEIDYLQDIHEKVLQKIKTF